MVKDTAVDTIGQPIFASHVKCFSDNNTLELNIPSEVGYLRELNEMILGTSLHTNIKYFVFAILLIFVFHTMHLCCHLCICFSDSNSFTGAIPSELGILNTLEYFTICKLCLVF